jgi:hypothetical protein
MQAIFVWVRLIVMGALILKHISKIIIKGLGVDNYAVFLKFPSAVPEKLGIRNVSNFF